MKCFPFSPFLQFSSIRQYLPSMFGSFSNYLSCCDFQFSILVLRLYRTLSVAQHPLLQQSVLSTAMFALLLYTVHVLSSYQSQSPVLHFFFHLYILTSPIQNLFLISVYFYSFFMPFRFFRYLTHLPLATWFFKLYFIIVISATHCQVPWSLQTARGTLAIPRHSTSRCCHTALISPLHTFRHFYKVGKVGNHQ